MVCYNDHIEKRMIQLAWLPYITKTKVICLGGPNVEEYSRIYPSHISIDSYEKDMDVYLQQLLFLENENVTLYNTDIINAPVDITAFYDLDFCGTVDRNAETIKKFKDCQFMLTLSSRCQDQQQKLFMTLGEKIVGKEAIDEDRSIIATDKNYYYHTKYMDSSSMSIYFKF